MQGEIEWFTNSLEYRELDPVEFEWNHFPGLTTLRLLREILRTMEENRIQPELFREKFEDRIIFMSVSHDIDWGKAGSK